VNSPQAWPNSTFDTADGLAPWYDASYVSAFSLPITSEPVNAVVPPGSASCGSAGCPENLLSHYPKAYTWSKQDTGPDNRTAYQCASCTGFTITFHGGS
jgi:hypothetical protein